VSATASFRSTVLANVRAEDPDPTAISRWTLWFGRLRGVCHAPRPQRCRREWSWRTDRGKRAKRIGRKWVREGGRRTPNGRRDRNWPNQ